jgi:ankyrin repeat protein
MDAIRMRCIRSLKALVSSANQGLINHQDEAGFTALFRAVNLAKEEYVRTLLDARADANIPTTHGSTPIIVSKSRAVTQMLIDANANVNTQSSNGNTALTHASGRGWSEIVTLLLQHNANPDAVDGDGNTALIRAVQNNRNEVAEILLNCQPLSSINAYNKKSASALTTALCQNHGLTRPLIKAGAAVNIADDEGITPVMHVRFSGCLHKLIDTDNMIVFHVDNKGYTPLMRLFEPASSLKGEDRKAIGYDDTDVDDCVRLMLDYMPICNRARLARLREAQLQEAS